MVRQRSILEKPHKKLEAWKLSMDLVIEVYRETEKFPNREKYGLLDQIRRATISIPSNIVLDKRMERIDKTISGLIHHLSKN